MRIELIRCDLCYVEANKPKSTPPEGWFSYSKTSQPLDLCPLCRKIIKKALST